MRTHPPSVPGPDRDVPNDDAPAQWLRLATPDEVDEEPSATRPADYIRRFVVRANDRAYLVNVGAVDFFEAARNYVMLHVGTRQYRLRATLQMLLHGLDPALFVRIHKSTIVNVDRVREVQPWFAGDYIAVLEDGRQLRVSRSFARTLLRPIQ